ncbi:hypothetical protein [Brevibacillus laterosporus]|nr:hypothetical protein [Brevibacillus laterosporus]MDN9010060.1 hypothetical protein [Brevibacillus laterosporus]MDO0940558.1 hypothetical protein [Brevibacillus laterosporus]
MVYDINWIDDPRGFIDPRVLKQGRNYAMIYESVDNPQGITVWFVDPGY